MSNDIESIHKALDAELADLKAANQRSAIIGGLACVVVGGYLAVLNSQLSQFFDPDGLALAASGAAVEAAPAVEDRLRTLLVDGAPDIARSLSNSVVEAIPTYRGVAEDELKPVIDEVSSILATTAVDSMLASDAPPALAEQQGAVAAADAVVERIDTMLNEAMNEPTEMNGPTPAQLIEQSVGQLEMVDRGLRRIARGGGDQAERELVLTLIAAIDAAQTEASIAEASAYSTKNDKKPQAAKPAAENAAKPAAEGAAKPAAEAEH